METEFTVAHRQDPARAENMLRRIPAGAWGRPEDLAGAAVFLPLPHPPTSPAPPCPSTVDGCPDNTRHHSEDIPWY